MNDRWGHEAGNAVLRDLAARLRQLLRAEDTIVRYGGDEFVVLLPGVRAPEAQRIAHRLRHHLVGARALDPQGREIAYSVAVGYASFPDDARQVGELFRLADGRMYEDKQARRAAAPAPGR